MNATTILLSVIQDEVIHTFNENKIIDDSTYMYAYCLCNIQRMKELGDVIAELKKDVKQRNVNVQSHRYLIGLNFQLLLLVPFIM